MVEYIMLHKKNGKSLFKVRKDLHKKLLKAIENKDANLVAIISAKMLVTSPDGIEILVKQIKKNLDKVRKKWKECGGD